MRLSGVPTRHIEQSLDRFDVPTVGEEQDHVIVALDHGVVVRDEYLVAARNGGNGRSLGKRNILDTFTDDAAFTLHAVHDDFQRLGRALPE